MRNIGLFCVLATLSSAVPALAAENCPELSTLQQWAGYVSWLGFLQVLGVGVMAVGLGYMFRGLLLAVFMSLRHVLEVLGYLAAVGLVAMGSYVPHEYLLWPVLGGCILFGACVMMTIWLHELKGDSPEGVFAILTVAWGAVAIYYNEPHVGFIAVGALLGLLGFSIIVTPFSYGFGFRKDELIGQVTGAALILLAAYVVQFVRFPDAPSAVTVFSSGAFWLGSFVAFVGLLIMSNRWYTRSVGAYVWMQLVTITLLLAGTFVGMTFNINELAGLAGVFLVFYLAAKPIEIPVASSAAFGFLIFVSGGILSGAWYLATQHADVVQHYITVVQQH